MRTTVRLPDALLAAAKRAVQEEETTLTRLIEEALRERLARRRQDTTAAATVRLRTAGRGGVLAGVDLDDTSALLDLMELP